MKTYVGLAMFKMGLALILFGIWMINPTLKAKNFKAVILEYGGNET